MLSLDILLEESTAIIRSKPSIFSVLQQIGRQENQAKPRIRQLKE